MREVERRIQTAEEQNANSTLPVPDRPVGIPSRFDDHSSCCSTCSGWRIQADLTRVFTLMYGRELNSRPVSRRSASRSRITACRITATSRSRSRNTRRLNTYHAELFAYFLEKLRSTPDGDGNLLDHTILLYGGAMSNPNVHLHVNLPLVVAGGGAGTAEGRTSPRRSSPATTCR